jgi:hypothetical protein
MSGSPTRRRRIAIRANLACRTQIGKTEPGHHVPVHIRPARLRHSAQKNVAIAALQGFARKNAAHLGGCLSCG